MQALKSEVEEALQRAAETNDAKLAELQQVRPAERR